MPLQKVKVGAQGLIIIIIFFFSFPRYFPEMWQELFGGVRQGGGGQNGTHTNTRIVSKSPINPAAAAELKRFLRDYRTRLAVHQTELRKF